MLVTWLVVVDFPACTDPRQQPAAAYTLWAALPSAHNGNGTCRSRAARQARPPTQLLFIMRTVHVVLNYGMRWCRARACRSDYVPMYGVVFMAWKTLDTSPAGTNNVDMYYAGGATLVHEVAHHLGVEHTFGDEGAFTCDDDDEVSDTPRTKGA